MSFRSCSCSSGQPWARTCREGPTITVRPHLGFSAVWIETHQDKAAEFLALDERLSLRKGLVDVKEILHVAGILGWASCLFPWFAAFNSALWGAIMKHGESQDALRKKLDASQLRANGPLACSLPHASQLRHAGSGLLYVLHKGAWWPTRDKTLLRYLPVCTDASPWGMASILYLKSVPHSWWAQETDENDLARMAAMHGGTAWQPEWELLAIVSRSLATTARDESCHTRPSRRLRSPWTHSCYEQSGSGLQDELLRGTLNFEADALSRLTQGSSVPVCNVSRVHPPVRDDFWFSTWPTPEKNSSSACFITLDCPHSTTSHKLSSDNYCFAVL